MGRPGSFIVDALNTRVQMSGLFTTVLQPVPDDIAKTPPHTMKRIYRIQELYNEK